MVRSCARARDLGLPAIAFTEHVDHTVWAVDIDELDVDDPLMRLSDADGRVTPPALDVTGYLASIERCRELFPDLRIASGLELGEPHWHADAVSRVLAAGDFDRVLGSLHCLPDSDGFREPPGLFDHRNPDEVVRSYLAEVARLVEQSDAFSVLAHIDYPVRSWPSRRFGPFDAVTFEEEFRHCLGVLAESGRALEINTVLPLDVTIVRWWRGAGGDAVTFGSDAHQPDEVAQSFADAVAMAETCGFRPGGNPFGPWPRTS
jgi:histidinol-phosphatase (PHP family)